MNEELKQLRLDKAGTFRATAVGWTIEKSEHSESIAIVIHFGVTQEWYPAPHESWSAAWPPGYWVEGKSWVIGKDGTLNESVVDNLRKCGLWNGDFNAITGEPPKTTVLLDVEANEYQGKTYYRANWISPNSEVPPARGGGGLKPVDADLLAQLRSRFGGQARAIAGAPAHAAGAPPAPPQVGGFQTPAPTPQPHPMQMHQPQPAPMHQPAQQAQPMQRQAPQAPPPPPAPAPMSTQRPSNDDDQDNPVDLDSVPF